MQFLVCLVPVMFITGLQNVHFLKAVHVFLIFLLAFTNRIRSLPSLTLHLVYINLLNIVGLLCCIICTF